MKQTPSTPVHIKDSELILNIDGFSKRGSELFKKLNKNEALRAEFIRNPSKIIAEQVTQRALPERQVSAGNRFIFSLLANADFIAWMAVFNRRVIRDNPDEETRLREFASAVTRFGDENILASLTELAAGGFGIPGITNLAYQCVSGACTPVSEAQNANLSQNFNMSTSNSGRDNPGNVINPAIVRSITEHLIAYARELSMLGALKDLSKPIV